MGSRIAFGLVFLLLTAHGSRADDMPRIQIADGGRGFVIAGSGQPFVPWGFNYDHDSEGRLLEDYWETDWESVQQDFAEMKQLGCNVVRIHLQFSKFMTSPTDVNEASLKKLVSLLDLAERTGLYLNLTGLGCYHKQDVPAWYDAMSTEQRWQAQSNFWSAIAKACAKRSCIFCYDLMNEPVVHGGDKPRQDWLGPGFGGKHFVQFICLDREGKSRDSLAVEWTEKLVQSIRQHDPQHLITIGLVPWSLPRPGLTSGFDPEVIAKHLDFISVHIYPESGKIDEAMETLRGFAEVGKPVVIEEIFPLKCNAVELEDFINQSRSLASGWIGFYWGTPIESLRDAKTIPAAMTASWLELFARKASEIVGVEAQIHCQGRYSHHLQGVCRDTDQSFYWSFTTKLVKTNSRGEAEQTIDVANHHGDACWSDGKVYVAVNLGKFNDPEGNADSWVYVYRASDLEFLEKHAVPEVFHGAGGISVKDGQFYVVGGLPSGVEENYVYQYDAEFNFVQKHVIASGHTHLGIQTALFADNKWWFGCYGDPQILLVTDANFKLLGRHTFDCSLGIVEADNGQYWTASGICKPGIGCSGMLRRSEPDEQAGLKMVTRPENHLSDN